ALRRPLRLPAAAAARLQEVSRFEIDRQTPFEAADVWFDARLLAQHGEQIEAELVVVPRRALEGATGIPPAWRELLAGVDVRDDAGEPLRIN
ncbi:hypothetical protein R0J87_20155, partial [Halomonas sp. SIMBA_159]